MLQLDQIAALFRVAVDHATLQDLYRLGAVRPEREAEDLASALAILTAAAVRHGLQLQR